MFCLAAIAMAAVFVFAIFKSRSEARETERVEQQKRLELENKVTSIIIVTTDTGRIFQCAKCGYIFRHEATVSAGKASAQISAQQLPVQLSDGQYYCQKCERRIVFATNDDEVNT
jgi:rubredoxin